MSDYGIPFKHPMYRYFGKIMTNLAKFRHGMHMFYVQSLISDHKVPNVVSSLFADVYKLFYACTETILRSITT